MTAPLGFYRCDQCQVLGELYETPYVCRDCDQTVCPMCRNTERDEDEPPATTVCKKCEADPVEVLDYYRTKGGTV